MHPAHAVFAFAHIPQVEAFAPEATQFERNPVICVAVQEPAIGTTGT
jgi:hypothetical protein